MDRSSAGNISCTFTATGDTGLTATATTTATVSVAPPPPKPQIVSQFSHNDIQTGNGSLLQIHTANATDVYLRCTGLWPAYGAIPVNQGWQGDWIVYNYSGKTNCVVTAQNAVGDTETVYPELRVYTTNADGDPVMLCTAATCTVPAVPSLPAATGSSGTGNIGGYLGPNGQIYSDPAGTQICNSCTSDGTPTNVGVETAQNPPPTDTDVNGTGNDDTTSPSPASNSY